MPMLLTSLVLGAALDGCPPDVCYETPPEPEPVVHGRRLRKAMRAFGPVRRRKPRFFTSEGTRLSPQMSIAAIERRLRADGGAPIVRVLWGRCASHDETCPWAEVELSLHSELDALDCDAPSADTVTRHDGHVVVEHRPDGALREFEVGIGPGGCAGDPRAEDDVAALGDPHSALVYVMGTERMVRAALKRLPMRTITRVLDR